MPSYQCCHIFHIPLIYCLVTCSCSPCTKRILSHRHWINPRSHDTTWGYPRRCLPEMFSESWERKYVSVLNDIILRMTSNNCEYCTFLYLLRHQPWDLFGHKLYGHCHCKILRNLHVYGMSAKVRVSKYFKSCPSMTCIYGNVQNKRRTTQVTRLVREVIHAQNWSCSWNSRHTYCLVAKTYFISCAGVLNTFICV